MPVKANESNSTNRIALTHQSLNNYSKNHCNFPLTAQFSTIGNVEILQKSLLGLLCSVRCPGMPILKTFDLMQQIKDKGPTIISGFHSPLEKECLPVLLRGKQPIVICPARSIETMRIPKQWQEALEGGRLLICSPFEPKEKRVTKPSSEKRNQFVATLAEQIIVPYAEPNGKTFELIQNVITTGKKVWTFDDPVNEPLIQIGAKSIGKFQF